MAFRWQPLRVGGGGFITGIDIAPDGTKVCRCDSFGAYIYQGGQWQQLCTASRLPAIGQTTFSNSGVFELRIAPSNSQVLYMFYGMADSTTTKPWLFVSTNQGASFVQMSNWTLVAANATGGTGEVRGFGPKAAVDPNNPDDFITSTHAGTTFETTNGTSGASATFTQLTSVTTGTVDACGCVAFDASSGTTGSPARTNVCYVSSWAQGLYLRTTPSGSFSLITGTSGFQITRLKVASNGNVFFITGTTSGGTTLYRLTWSAGPGSTPTVTNITPTALATVCHTFLLDPANPAHITAFAYGTGGSGQGYADSTSAGTVTAGGWSPNNNVITSTAPNAPYLITGNPGNVVRFASEILADPASPSNIYFVGWQGMFTMTYPLAIQNVNQPCVDFSLGIEQMATDSIVAPPGYKTLLCAQDWGFLQSQGPNSPPLRQGWNAAHDLEGGWHADYAGSTVVAVATGPFNQATDDSAVSSDGGATWTAWGAPSSAAYPNSGNNQYGCIAVADAAHWVQVGGGGSPSQPYYTLNGGTSWTQIVNPGGVATSSGYGFFYTAPRRIVAADRVNIGTFYMWNYTYGFFRSLNNGVGWTNYNNYDGSSTPGVMDPAAAFAYLKSVPGVPDNLFFCAYGGSGGGYTGPNTAARFWRTTDGGQHWTKVGPSSVTAVGAIIEVWCFGFGAHAPGQSYPSVYIYGWMYNGTSYVQGVYQSDDNCVTWTQIGDKYPDGWTDWVKDLTGDMNAYGVVYIAKSGSSFGVRFNPAPGPNIVGFSVGQSSAKTQTRMIGY